MSIPGWLQIVIFYVGAFPAMFGLWFLIEWGKDVAWPTIAWQQPRRVSARR